jgi:hypothetical protein
MARLCRAIEMGVLHGDRDLGGKQLEQLEVAGTKLAQRGALSIQRTDDPITSEDRHAHLSAYARNGPDEMGVGCRIEYQRGVTSA